MSSTTSSPYRFPSADQVIATGLRILKELSDYELDEIDGEFYWRCCRADLMAALESFRRDTPPALDEVLAHDSVFARFRYMRQAALWSFALLNMYRDMQVRYPGELFLRL